MKKIVFLCITAMFFAACSNDGNEVQQAPSVPVPIMLGTSMQTKTTRSNSQTLQATELTSGAAVGVYVYPTGYQTTTSSYGYLNLDYAVSGTSGDLTISSTSQPYFPEDKTTNVDIYAFSPRAVNTSTTDELSALTSVAFTTTADQTAEADYIASDFVWGSITNVTNGTTTAVEIPLEHMLSKLNINIAAGNGVSTMTGATITLDGVNLSGLIDLTDGSVSTNGSTTSTLTFTSSTSDTGTFASDGTTVCYTSSAVIIPQTVSGTLTITLSNGSSYTYSISSAAFAAKTVYTYDITINAQGLSLTTSITNWTTGTTTTGTAE